MTEILNLMLDFSHSIGYTGIIVLMTIESSFIPFPSEIIIPPAAYLASLGKMNIYLVIISGIIGSLLGAIINYILALTLGRKIIFILANTKVARMLLITENKIAKAENYFLKYGNVSTFIGRLVPAVRQLISIPAGFSKMNFGKFIFYTFLGSATWTIILALLGYTFGANQELLLKYYKQISLAFIILALVVIFGIILYQKKKK